MARDTQQVELMAEKRTVTGKQVRQLRRDGWVPGVMYGHGFESVPLQFEERSLAHILSRVGGSQLVGINVKGDKQPEMALVRDVQRDPIRGNFLHVDFYRVMMTERLTTEIPLVTVGESPVTEAREGILLQGISSIEVECLPGDLVDAIEVDLSDLIEIDQGVYVRDLAVPAGIDVLTDPDEMIVRIVPLEAEEIEEEEEEEELMPGAEEVEVLTEAKEEETASD
jgi:large subunit ribosomal protein L25